MDIAWWDLDGTPQTIDSLREHLRDSTLARWAAVPGLRLKCWIADHEHNRWGAVMLWEAERPQLDQLPPNEAARLIGGPPTVRQIFEVEAAAQGRHALADLHGLGPALAVLLPTPSEGMCEK